MESLSLKDIIYLLLVSVEPLKEINLIHQELFIRNNLVTLILLYANGNTTVITQLSKDQFMLAHYSGDICTKTEEINL